MTLYLGSLQRVLLRFSDLRLLWVMYILGAVCLHLRHGGYDVSGFFLGEAGGLSAGICLVFPYPGCWRYGPLLCCPFRWAAPGTLRVSLMMVYLSVHSLFSFKFVISRPERSYVHLV